MSTTDRIVNNNNVLLKRADSGDYIKAKRNMAIYKEYSKTMNTPDLNPVKTNGYQYNRNFNFIPASSVDASNCLIQTKNYELLQNYTNGQTYTQQQCDPTIPPCTNCC